MKKILLVVALITVSSLLSSCGTWNRCCGTTVSYSSGDGCCGSNGYGGIWY